MVKTLQNVKIKILCMLNLHGVLFCTGIDLDDIMQIVCLLISILFFIANIGWLQHLVLCSM